MFTVDVFEVQLKLGQSVIKRSMVKLLVSAFLVEFDSSILRLKTLWMLVREWLVAVRIIATTLMLIKID